MTERDDISTSAFSFGRAVSSTVEQLDGDNEAIISTVTPQNFRQAVVIVRSFFSVG